MTTPPPAEPSPTPQPPLPQSTPTTKPSAPKKSRQQRKRADAASPSSQPPLIVTAGNSGLQPPPPPPQHQQQQRVVVQTQPPPPPPQVFQHYPGPPYPIMNPSYGSPYQHPQHPQHPHAQPLPTATPQYAYSMHPNPYPHHAYSPYTQYPQPMMMYPPPRQPPDATAAAANAAQQDPQQQGQGQGSAPSTGQKRKRKAAEGAAAGRGKPTASDEDNAASGSENPRPPPPPPQSASAVGPHTPSSSDAKKRTKTQRACDSCRSRKIRCDVITDNSEAPVCQHCKQYGFECTFFLPITETRFKKKKLEEEAAAAADKDKVVHKHTPAADEQQQHRKTDGSVFGLTSPAHLLHSQANIPPRVYESYDARYMHSFQVSKTGDGLIEVQKAPDGNEAAYPKPLQDLHIDRDVIERLINVYFSDIASVLPIITKAEFLSTPNPPPILVYSICLVAAARRDVSQQVFDAIRYIVNRIIKADDVLSTASVVNVQSLLILCMTGDCHSQFVPNALSALWIRLGSAIRMAQDLGLHRAESLKSNIELRRRLWAACLICDRWIAIAYGHPYMIDVQDCDARLPSSGDSEDLYLDELVRLSILLGRVQKTIYNPSGLNFTTDATLESLLKDMQDWREQLPDHLKLRGPDSPRTAGLLHLLYCCVSMMFWRVFMRISYSCPAHLKFGLTVEQWSLLVQMTADAIDWLDANEGVYDVWLLVAYAATSCALVQYHTCIRRKDEQAQAKLRKLRNCVRRWERSISPDHMSARRKTAEIIALLYEATTQGPPPPIGGPALNPTSGVTAKNPVLLDYKKDPSRPGGGVFVANKTTVDSGALADVAPGTVISGEDAINEGEMASPSGVVASVSFVGKTDNDRVRAMLFSSSPSIFAPLPLPPSSTSLPASDDVDADAASRMLLALGQTSSSTSSSSSAARQAAANTLVNITPFGGRNGTTGELSNVNPALNVQAYGGDVQILNTLDMDGSGGLGNGTGAGQVGNGQSGGADYLTNLAIADNGFLEGLPGGMFDWGQWDTFFAKFGATTSFHNGDASESIGGYAHPTGNARYPS